MKDIPYTFKDLADTTWQWMPVTLPKGWLQYVETTWSNPLSANGHYVIVALAHYDDTEAKPSDDPVVSDGHIIFRKIVYMKLATSGLEVFISDYIKKMYNYEIPKAMRFWLGFKHSRGDVMSYRFNFWMSDEKLLEVV